MLKKILLSTAFLMAVAFAPSSGAADPTLHEVYQAAEAGRLDEAQSMMQTVLHDHPNSAKAHFVEAELLGKQGRLVQAGDELKTAERLAPGLPFAQPQAVSNLKTLISGARAPHYGMAAMAPVVPAASAPHLPWGLIILVLLGIGFVVYIMRSRNAAQAASGGVYPNAAAYPNGSTYGPGTYGAPYPAPQPGGIGSGILGGLATGAAVGAGVVAGEALMHHFIDGDRPHDQGYIPPAPAYPDTSADDMGGTDFGISDNSSWDDVGGGGSDWDS